MYYIPQPTFEIEMEMGKLFTETWRCFRLESKQSAIFVEHTVLLFVLLYQASGCKTERKVLNCAST